ncbi:hypothetical protein HY932_02010 [Candidatus Falkowbacteria bacterium]|nr:hypothetical protein [Candidatus Falkowbacteria bacterium]
MHRHLISMIVLIVLFALVFSLGFYFGTSYKNAQYYNQGFTAGFDNALNSLVQNNVIPSQQKITTANAILKQKNKDQFIVEVLPNISMPIINPQDKIKTLNIDSSTTFCKITQKPIEQIMEQTPKNQPPIISEQSPAAIKDFAIDQKIQITTSNDIFTNNALIAKQICLY